MLKNFQPVPAPARTLLETFEFVAEHMVTQGERSVSPRDTGSMVCAYRGLFDRKCAVGCLIDDATYTVAMEGQGVRSLFGAQLSGPHASLLESLQYIHDKIQSSNWPKRLGDLRRVVVGGAYGDPNEPFESLSPLKRVPHQQEEEQ